MEINKNMQEIVLPLLTFHMAFGSNVGRLDKRVAGLGGDPAVVVPITGHLNITLLSPACTPAVKHKYVKRFQFTFQFSNCYLETVCKLSELVLKIAIAISWYSVN